MVLTLPPLSSDGYRQMLRTLIGARPDRPATPSTATSTAPDTESSSSEPTATQRNASEEGASELWQQGLYGAELPAARVVERIDPLTLEPDELELLDLLGPPLLVATPRGVKRLANSYGLLTQLRGSRRQSDLAEITALANYPLSEHVSYFPYRAGMVLLAALISYPSLGPALFLHLHHTAAKHSDWTWQQYLASLTPRQEESCWRNPADPHMTPVEAQQWQALLQSLDHVTTKAADAQLDLPEPLTAWAEWIIPVGRLSFPTGRIVTGLERSAPLPPDEPPA